MIPKLWLELHIKYNRLQPRARRGVSYQGLCLAKQKNKNEVGGPQEASSGNGSSIEAQVTLSGSVSGLELGISMRTQQTAANVKHLLVIGIGGIPGSGKSTSTTWRLSLACCRHRFSCYPVPLKSIPLASAMDPRPNDSPPIPIRKNHPLSNRHNLHKHSLCQRESFLPLPNRSLRPYGRLPPHARTTLRHARPNNRPRAPRR